MRNFSRYITKTSFLVLLFLIVLVYGKKINGPLLNESPYDFQIGAGGDELALNEKVELPANKSFRVGFLAKTNVSEPVKVRLTATFPTKPASELGAFDLDPSEGYKYYHFEFSTADRVTKLAISKRGNIQKASISFDRISVLPIERINGNAEIVNPYNRIAVKELNSEAASEVRVTQGQIWVSSFTSDYSYASGFSVKASFKGNGGEGKYRALLFAKAADNKYLSENALAAISFDAASTISKDKDKEGWVYLPLSARLTPGQEYELVIDAGGVRTSIWHHLVLKTVDSQKTDFELDAHKAVNHFSPALKMFQLSDLKDSKEVILPFSEAHDLGDGTFEMRAGLSNLPSDMLAVMNHEGGAPQFQENEKTVVMPNSTNASFTYVIAFPRSLGTAQVTAHRLFQEYDDTRVEVSTDQTHWKALSEPIDPGSTKFDGQFSLASPADKIYVRVSRKSGSVEGKAYFGLRSLEVVGLGK